MSRIGKKPIDKPEQVTVNVIDNVVSVAGPKGSLTLEVPSGIEISVEDNQVLVKRATDQKEHRSLHGLTRALLANMVEGVTKGFEKKLDIVGVGYRAQMQGKKLVLSVGYSHPVEVEPPEGIEIEVPAATKIVIKGIDKQQVGDMAAKIRAIRKPEPYKGKGIKYENEIVRRKAGKAGAR